MGFTPVEVSNFYPRETFTPAEISNFYMRNLYTPRSLQTPFTPVEVSNFYPDGLQPVQARLHLSNISALNTCRTFHLCISQCLPRPVSLEPMSAASGGLQPVHARPCPSMPVYTCPTSPLLHPSKFIHGISQCPPRPVTLGTMPAGRGGPNAGGTRWTETRPSP